MITFDEAQHLLREHVKPGRVVELPVVESLGLTLARPVAARADSPRFDSSSVDGYAVTLVDFAADFPITLPVVARVQAGASSRKPIQSGTTQRILTGAPVPKGADAIVMQEDVMISGKRATFHRVPDPGANIRSRGAELRRGEQLFERGATVTPAVAQALAAYGYAKVRVYARPSVSIIVTGDELRDPGSKLEAGQIWDSNSIGLLAALSALGISSVQTEHVSDNPRSTTTAVRKALERSDIVIATGGVSVGDRDYVKGAFSANGVREIFWRVRMKPGKPLYFGVKRHAGRTKYVFGLPGNPVSVMATYQLFARLCILRMMGRDAEEPRLRGTLKLPLRKSDPRLEFVRAYRETTSDSMPKIVPLAARDSHMTTGMAKADCLIVFPADQTSIEAGDEVEIVPILWASF